jgi:hypothetical protein
VSPHLYGCHVADASWNNPCVLPGASLRRHAARCQTVIFSTSRGTRLKMIKRQMYGRAGFGLLRKRVLLAR